MLKITNLHATVADKPILNGVSLHVPAGEVHAIMGPNGSGKSTLAYSVAGHPKYTITAGTVTLDGADVLAMTPWQRAHAGLFLALQYPTEVPGVSLQDLLESGAKAVSARRLDSARKAAERHRCCVLLKGSDTLVVEGEKVAVNSTGNVALATAGTGDLLSGVIGALLSRGMDTYEAARAGAWGSASLASR